MLRINFHDEKMCLKFKIDHVEMFLVRIGSKTKWTIILASENIRKYF